MVLSIMSKDRPGIVADVTGVIYQLGGDLADLNQSVLCGYFTMILIVTFEESVTPEDVITQFSHIKSKTRLNLVIKELQYPVETNRIDSQDDSYVLTVQGKNRSGLVYSIGKFCSDHRINIMDLATTLVEDKYTMVLQLDLSQADSIDTINTDLEIFAGESGLTLMIQHNDIFEATHEIRLP